MKILLIGPGMGIPIPPIGWGGIEKVIWKHAQCFKSAGHHVQIYNGRDPDYLLKEISARNYDVIHAHEDWAYYLLRCSRIPFFFTSHRSDWRKIRSNLEERFQSDICYPILFRQMYQVFDAPNKLGPIDNGADDSLFQYIPERKIKNKCIAIGNNEPRKNFRDLIKIFRHPNNHRKELFLIGPNMENLKDSSHKNIHILNNLPEEEIAKHLIEAEYFFHLSEEEADCLVVREAAMAGCKLILSEYCADTIAIENCTTDVENFSDCDIPIIADKAKENWTWEIVSQNVLEQYKKVLG